ncbi:transcript variant X2 [Nothobranchius furzeri]|uniref:Transcript variant X2 n=1 Tax=Nothobranchius furzeri TaxID=105023 RepID=A0A9D3BV85_NOTFU|nr:transcript variant X2 [Nothobranchius furzeri]
MMDSYFSAICVTFLAAFCTCRSGANGPVVTCEPCDLEARLLCKPLPKDCAQKVREPGCGCCMTCALSFGQPCGVYTGRCGSGLSCQPQPGETTPLQALIEGRGICVNATKKSQTVRPTPPVNELPENPESHEKEQNSTGSSLQTAHNGHTVPARHPLPPPYSPTKADILRQEEITLIFKTEDLSAPVITKQEAEYGPCRREIESILNKLKIANILNPRGFRIPNCDKKGFYKKKQEVDRESRSKYRSKLDGQGAVRPKGRSEVSVGVWTNMDSPCQDSMGRREETSSTPKNSWSNRGMGREVCQRTRRR